MLATPTIYSGTFRLLATVLLSGASLFVTTFATAADETSAVREWSDKSGKFKITATLTRVDGDKVSLLREDGKTVALQLGQLSGDDQIYVIKVMSGAEPTQEFDISTGEVKLRSLASATPQTPSTNGPSDSKQPEATPRPTTPGRGYIEAETNVSFAPLLTLAEEGETWSYVPDGVMVAEVPATRQVRMTFDPKALPAQLPISISPGSKTALVSDLASSFFGHNSSDQCKLAICDLANGKVTAMATATGEKPLAISPDGSLLAMVSIDTWKNNGPEIRLYHRDGDSLKRYIMWRPYAEDAKGFSHPRVEWGTFLGNDRLLTIDENGLLALWEVPDVQPVWCVKLNRGAAPVMSPGGKYLAMIADKKLLLVELESTRVVGSLPTTLGGTHGFGGARLAFRGDGKRLAGIYGDEVCVWDLETKKLVRNFNLQITLDNDDCFAWIDDNHLLVGRSVIDVDRRVRIWGYSGTRGCAVQDGRLWFVGEPSAKGELTLASTRGVPKQAIDAVAKLKPEDLVLIGPGMDVAVEISASGDVQSAREDLERKLKDNGMKIVPSSKVRLIGTVQPGENKQVRVVERKGPIPPTPTNPFDKSQQPPGELYNVNEYTVNLCIKVGEETVWRRDYKSTLPDPIWLKEGETVSQAIQRLTYLDAAYLKSYALPKCLARLPAELTK
jgi:hypothetical protein